MPRGAWMSRAPKRVGRGGRVAAKNRMTAAGQGKDEGPWRHEDAAVPDWSRPPGQPAESDAALIGRSCSQPQAFAAIFDRHAEELYRYVVGRIGVQAAADVVAEVFVVAFRNRDRYDRDRPDARPWLYGIATRLVGQHRREERRRIRALARVAAPGAVEGVEEHATDRIMAQQLHPRLARRCAGCR